MPKQRTNLNAIIADVLADPGLHDAMMEHAMDIALRAAEMADELVGKTKKNKKGDLKHTEPAYYAVGELSMKKIGKEKHPRPRINVWAVNGAAMHAETKASPLMQIVANDGANKSGGSDVSYKAGR